MRAVVDEDDAQPLAFVAAQGRSRHLAVVSPGREKDTGGDLDLLVDRDDLPLAYDRAVGRGVRVAVVKGTHESGRVVSHALDVDVADRAARRVPVVLTFLMRV